MMSNRLEEQGILRAVVTGIAIFSVVIFSMSFVPASAQANEPGQADEPGKLKWERLPDLPGALGVAGPAVGVHNDALIVAGGANFPRPVWDNDKVWRDKIHVLVRKGEQHVWRDGGRLATPLGYAAVVSTADGVVCMGGNDAESVFRDVFLLRWNPEEGKVERQPYPPLPKPCAFGQAALIGNAIYLAGGQSGEGLDSALHNFWMLDLSAKGTSKFQWRSLPAWPGKSRSLNLTVAQDNGVETCIYVMSGRRLDGEDVEFLKDVWEYSPAKRQWKQRRDAPRSVMAGMAAGYGDRTIYVLGGADGEFYHTGAELRDKHPGFPKQALAFDTVANQWKPAGTMPASHVTTVPARWNDHIIIASGEIRPRVRTKAIYRVAPK